VSSLQLTDVRKIYPVGDGTEVRAVDGVTLTIGNGDRVGIVGPNGAGKSTLLQMIAGLTTPSSGSVNVTGHVTAIMTLGVGLRDQATGRDNIYLDGELQGKSRAEVREVVDEVIAFSELGDFIDQPVRTYSTGMKARLAFSMLCHIDPEILIIDEALSVGDAAFSRKAAEKIREICGRGRIVIIVSHSMTAIREICNRCLWLEGGRVVADGTPVDVTDRYIDRVRRADQREALARFSELEGCRSIVDGWRIAVALHQGGAPDRRLLESGSPLAVRISGHAPDRESAIAVEIVRLDGARMFSEQFRAGDYANDQGGIDLEISMEPLVLGPGTYRLDAALVSETARAAECSAVCEVYTSLPPAGGKPMLMYPIAIEVKPRAACQD
jgi:lipopolysaccharide transport system ATP-binding protein